LTPTQKQTIGSSCELGERIISFSAGEFGLQSKPSCHGGVSSVQQPFSEERGKRSFRAWLGLLIFTVLLWVLSAWNLELSGRDSPRVAGIAREMAVTSNYLIPRLNGENFLEYPPLGYWPIVLSLSMSEKPPDILAFIPLVFFGTGTILITFLIGKTLAVERIGLIAGFILSTTSGFVSLHRDCRVDPALLFFITLSMYGFVAGYQTSRKSFLFPAVFYLSMAGAFLSKGIVGAAIPIVAAAMFLVTTKDLKVIRKLLLSPGILLFLLPILLWVGSVWWLEGLGISKEIIRQSFWRFLSPWAPHAKPFYYYFTRAFLYLMPWTLLLFVLLGYRRNPNHSRGLPPDSFLLRFALVWFLTVFVGLSLASAKRPLYLGPILPPFSLLAALGWDRIREKFPKVKRGEVYGLIVIFLVCIGTYLLFITPSERKESLRPVFKAVSSQRTHGPVYLVNPSERLRGAAFFYLGKRTLVLNAQDLLLGRCEDRAGITLVVESYWDDNQFLSYFRPKEYRLILDREFGKYCVRIYSNSS
jgi:4-amino-4-deoxy-L-arabinose transferase-like glycosyltransferase